MESKKKKEKSSTQKGIILRLYKDNFIDERVLWNLLGSRFKKPEIEEIDKTFRSKDAC